MTFIVPDLDKLIDYIPDGSTLAIGGNLLYRHPMGIVRALIRTGRKDMTIISPLGSIDVDLLVGSGVARKIIFGYVGFEILGFAPNFKKSIESGFIDWEECGTASMVRRLEAAQRGASGVHTPFTLGSEIYNMNEKDHITHNDLPAQPFLEAIQADIAVVHAQWADKSGNLKIVAPSLDAQLILASRTAVASVEKIVSDREFSSLPGRTIPRRYLSAVCEAPLGAHPTSCWPFYAHDLVELIHYLQISKQDETFKTYLEQTIYFRDEQQYGQHIGDERINLLKAFVSNGQKLIIT